MPVEESNPLSFTLALIMMYLRGRSLAVGRLLNEFDSAAVIAISGPTNQDRAKELRREGLLVEKLINAYDDYFRLHPVPKGST